MRRIPIMTIVFLLLSPKMHAQELDCTVNVASLATLPSETKDNLSDFAIQIEQYINGYRWTDQDYGNEKIKCTISISFVSATGTHYTAQAFIGSQRPIYKTGRNTACLRIKDENWEFDYVRGQSLTHSDTRFDALLSFIDYYAYIILGYDADTYKTFDGTPYFQKASDIVNRAIGTPGAGKGWEVSQQETSYSRQQLVDELLSPKFQDFRRAVHIYYYRGLDSLHDDQTKGMNKMLSALEKIGKLQEKINQPSLVTKVFFDSKYLEIAETFLESSDSTIYSRLIKIDPNHEQTYIQYGTKRQKE